MGYIWSVRRAAKCSSSHKVLVNVCEGYCMSTKVIPEMVKFNVRSQKVTRKYKSQTCHATHVFWVILPVDIDSDGHLIIWRHQTLLLTKARSRSGKNRSSFQINIFCEKAYGSVSEFPQASKYALSFLIRWVKLPNIASQKLTSYLFSLMYFYKNAKNKYLFQLHVHL